MGLMPGRMSRSSGRRPYAASLPLDVGVEVPTFLERLLGGEDRLGEPGGILPASLARAGLDQRRVALHGPADVQGSAHLEVLAAVLDRGDEIGVSEHPGLLVGHHGLVVEGVPESLGHLDELGRSGVPRGIGRR
jgi:hypothetical protein